MHELKTRRKLGLGWYIPPQSRHYRCRSFKPASARKSGRNKRQLIFCEGFPNDLAGNCCNTEVQPRSMWPPLWQLARDLFRLLRQKETETPDRACDPFSWKLWPKFAIRGEYVILGGSTLSCSQGRRPDTSGVPFCSLTPSLIFYSQIIKYYVSYNPRAVGPLRTLFGLVYQKSNCRWRAETSF